MNISPLPLKGAVAAPHPRAAVADARSIPSREPEWPRLTRREMREIVLDILG